MTPKQHVTIALIGNPNCGKTTLFNGLTGARQRVGNWPGVTVEKKTGYFNFEDARVEVVDLPGTYSLDAADGTDSLDEDIARQFVQSGEADLFINIVDASNLERNLYLTSQLADTGVPMLMALNMVDVAKTKGLAIDTEALEDLLGCPVVALVASQGNGITTLKQAVRQAVEQPQSATLVARLDETTEALVTHLQNLMKQEFDAKTSGHRWTVLRLLENTERSSEIMSAKIRDAAQAIHQQLQGDFDLLVADARYTLANQTYQSVVRQTGKVSRDITEQIDSVVLNRALGIPIFLLSMYLMFMLTINIGGAFIDFFDQAVGAILVDAFAQWLTSISAPEWLTVLLANGIGGGIQTIATFIPIIGFLYLCLSALEDSGYMARAAFVIDRLMRAVGLPGKSFVPLIVGFGCNVPAIMATRTLEQRRDRLVTIAMAPFMSCGARLPVYVLFAAAFFPNNAQNVVFGLYLIGIAAAMLTGLAIKHSLLRSESAPFIMELPPYHLPSPKSIAIHTWDRLKSFIIGAGRIIVPMVMVLNFMNALGTDGTFGHEDSESSVLAEVGRTIAPAFSPFGLDEQNWPAAVGIFTGILAKEAVVGTLNATYGSLNQHNVKQSDGEDFVLSTALTDAVTTIADNLTAAFKSWADPMGLTVGDLSNIEANARQQNVSAHTFGVMAQRFDGSAGAFAYLLFILLYFPCTAATAAIYRESGLRWALFVVTWTTGLGYGLATLWFQLANIARQPVTAAIWIAAIAATACIALIAMRLLGSRLQTPVAV